jgi:predicted porin
MKLKIMSLLVLVSGLAHQSAVADNVAVNQLNFEISPMVSTANDVGESVDVVGDATFPLAPVLGMSIAVGAGTFSGDDSYIDSDSTSVAAGIFVGHYDIGRVGLGIASSSSDYDSDDSFTITSDSVSLRGELYLKDFTLAAGYVDSEDEVDDDTVILLDPDSELTRYEIGYYPTENFRLGIGARRKDGDSEFIEAEFQPIDRISVFMNMAKNDDMEAYSVGVTIYFSGGSSLKENDRWY